ncbi:helix-turn-helix transcriptional regulator [Dactylosporangium darangshiense]|uniref:helix-turn-helix transcriptional regulator n=1 Tax=Dactylosporangium darangshiense TaxID=579108 RepID=UPI00362D91FD
MMTLLVVFVVYPIAASLGYTFYRWNGIGDPSRPPGAGSRRAPGRRGRAAPVGARQYPPLDARRPLPRGRAGPGYLAALFVQEVGVSPHRYLTEHRIRLARHLLATGDLPVTAIGLAEGFGSGQHFARVFRRVTGESPSEHRRSVP